MDIILEIQNEKDLEALMPLLKRLGITVKRNPLDRPPISEQKLKDLRERINKGTKIEDIESFVRAFEETRKDKSLPGRE